MCLLEDTQKSGTLERWRGVAATCGPWSQCWIRETFGFFRIILEQVLWRAQSGLGAYAEG